ncbi:MAG: C25 family cysteine peptidase [Anaerolineales bacterium]|nr:C25 family cysteine peptidase [Anaerolineales bacterium]
MSRIRGSVSPGLGGMPNVLLGLLWLALAAGCSGEPAMQTAAGTDNVLKIYLAEPGFYELAATDLQPYGLDRDLDGLSLTLRGETQPLWIAERDGAAVLRFYGVPSESRYTSESVYFLQHNPQDALSMERSGASDEIGTAEEIGLSRLRLEQNLRYNPKVASGDHFLWSSIPAPGSQQVEFDLPQPAADGRQHTARIRIEVWAGTEAPANPDHHFRISLNGRLLGDAQWDGAGPYTISLEIPPGSLVASGNRLLLEAPGLPGVAADIVFLDKIEITYPRRLLAEEGRLELIGLGAIQKLDGFEGPSALFDVSDPGRPLRLAEWDGGEHTFLASSGREYLALGPEGYNRPTRLEPARLTAGINRDDLGADYLAVGPSDLLEPLSPLLAAREQGGMQTAAVALEVIYDQFGDGFPEPEAIQAFVRHTAERWHPAPRYLLLVGDSSYDPQGWLTPAEANRLPTFLLQTVYGGETASDVPFGQLGGDAWSEIAIGRVPARSAPQVRDYVRKVLDYEAQAAAGRPENRILAVADNQDPNFREDAERFLGQFSSGYVTALYSPGAGGAAPAQELEASLDAGPLLLAYFGHGSVTQWGRDEILTAETVHSVGQGGRLPFVVNMTCLTGLFTHPEVDSLAESLLWAQDSGAVAVLAPTSLTLPTDQSILSSALAEALQNDHFTSLGEIATHARQKVPTDTPGGRDVMLTFLLFGDPALRIPAS